MATWKTPNTSHTVEDQVTPDIFNTLAENEIYLKDTKIVSSQVQDGAVTSTESTTRANISSGDTVKVAFGKLRKWFSDFGVLCFLDKVDTDQIEATSVTMGKIASNAVSTGKLDGLAVTTAKIANAAVTDVKLAVNSVITEKILDLAVTTSKLADLAVTSAKLATSAVTTAKIADLNVTTAKLANGSVTTAKLADGAVTDVKVSDVAASKITGLAAVATSGKYSDLTGTPSFSSFTLTRGTYTVDKQYNIPATGLYLPFIKFTNNAGYVSVSCMGTFSNKAGQVNPSYSSISSIYYSGQKQIQLRCVYVSSTALRYEVYISSNATTAPSTLWTDYSDSGTLELIMYKIDNFSAIW